MVELLFVAAKRGQPYHAVVGASQAAYSLKIAILAYFEKLWGGVFSRRLFRRGRVVEREGRRVVWRTRQEGGFRPIVGRGQKRFRGSMRKHTHVDPCIFNRARGMARISRRTDSQIRRGVIKRIGALASVE